MSCRLKSVHARSLTNAVNAWLAISRQPRILHIFDPACNLINEHKEILSVVTRQVGNGPFNLVTGDEISFSRFIHADSTVFIGSDQLVLGELTINTANGEIWNPRPDWEMLHARRDAILHSLLNLEIAPATSTLQMPNYQSLVSTLCSSIVNSDISSAVNAASNLSGLGNGLTPAGDDVMLGTIYAAWIIHPAAIAKSLAEHIANAAAPRTTSLSGAWLRSAGKGETGILWHRFFNQLSAEPIADRASSTSLLNAADRIQMVGETSGADALSGFVRTFAFYAEKTRP